MMPRPKRILPNDSHLEDSDQEKQQGSLEKEKIPLPAIKDGGHDENNIFIVHNGSNQALQITVPKLDDHEVRTLSVLYDIDGKEEEIQTSILIMTVDQTFKINFLKSKKFRVELLNFKGAVVEGEILDVPERGSPEINLEQNVSTEFLSKINRLYINRQHQCFPALNINQLPEEYKYIYKNKKAYNLLIAGSIKSRNWQEIKSKQLETELHNLFAIVPDRETQVVYVFTSLSDNIEKNFGLSKKDGQAMTRAEIGHAASYIRKMYTGMYVEMVDLFADTDDVFMEKLDKDVKKLKSVYDSWKVREYKTNHWFYNDLRDSKYQEIIFSSRGGTVLSMIYYCEFEHYEKGCGEWPDALITYSKPIYESKRKYTSLIDAFCIMQYPSSSIFNLCMLPKYQKELQLSCKNDTMPDLYDFRHKHVVITDKYNLEDYLQEDYKSTAFPLIVWCAEGVDELKRRERDSTENKILQFIETKKPEIIILCMKYGVEYVAEDILLKELGLDCDILCMETNIFETFMTLNFIESTMFLFIDKVLRYGVTFANKTYEYCSLHSRNLCTNELRCTKGHVSCLSRLRKGIECNLDSSIPTADWLCTDVSLKSLQLKLDDIEVIKKLRRPLKDINRGNLCFHLKGNLNDVRSVALHFCNSITRSDLCKVCLFRVVNDKDAKNVLQKIATNESYIQAVIWFDHTVENDASFLSDEQCRKFFTDTRLSAATIMILLTGDRDESLIKILKEARSTTAIHTLSMDEKVIGDQDINFDFHISYRELKGTFKINPIHASGKGLVEYLWEKHGEKNYLRTELSEFLFSGKNVQSSAYNEQTEPVDIYQDRQGRAIVCLNIMNIKQLKLLFHRVVFQNNLQDKLVMRLEFPVKSIHFDLPSCMRMYENLVLRLSTLTEEQENAVSSCCGERLIHIRGPAGTGKTFIAIHYILVEKKSWFLDPNADKVLYISDTKALAFYFAKWVCSRILVKEERNQVLKKIQFLAMDSRDKMEDDVCFEIEVDDKGKLQEHNGSYNYSKSRGRCCLFFCKEFGTIVVDEAHNIFCNESRKDIVNNILCKNKTAKVIMLSDISQASVSEDQIDFPSAHTIKLTDNCRSSKRLTVGAMSYQLGDTSLLKCEHDCDGAMLQTYIFQMAFENTDLNRMAMYAEYIVEAIDHVRSTFGNIDLHNRLAILVPDDDFCSSLKSDLCKLINTGEQDYKFSMIDAIDYARYVDRQEREPREDCRIIVDTVEAMSGMEFMIVFGVGFDRILPLLDRNAGNSNFVRSQIYKAMTRAHLSFYFINEKVEDGWLDWLHLVESDDYGERYGFSFEYEKSRFDRSKSLGGVKQWIDNMIPTVETFSSTVYAPAKSNANKPFYRPHFFPLTASPPSIASPPLDDLSSARIDEFSNDSSYNTPVIEVAVVD